MHQQTNKRFNWVDGFNWSSRQATLLARFQRQPESDPTSSLINLNGNNLKHTRHLLARDPAEGKKSFFLSSRIIFLLFDSFFFSLSFARRKERKKKLINLLFALTRTVSEKDFVCVCVCWCDYLPIERRCIAFHCLRRNECDRLRGRSWWRLFSPWTAPRTETTFALATGHKHHHCGAATDR